jgi:hypothetical protein
MFLAFHKGRLYFIAIEIKGYAKNVRKKLKKAYGEPYQENKLVESYYWFGDLVTLGFDQKSKTDDSTIRLFSKVIADEISKANEEKEKK